MVPLDPKMSIVYYASSQVNTGLESSCRYGTHVSESTCNNISYLMFSIVV